MRLESRARTTMRRVAALLTPSVCVPSWVSFSVSIWVSFSVSIWVSTAALAQQPSRWPPASRVVVVGDVHGAYEELVGLLAATGIVDEQLRWSGGEDRLVSLGDLLDRGAESRRVMDLLMRLQDEAAAAGGGVHVVLGNHEQMNLIGDLRYVSRGELSAFGAEEPDGVREAARERFMSGAAELAAEEAAARFDERYPRGYFGHRQAFGLDGRYGAWLLTLPTLLVIGDTAFVHGGLPALVAEMGDDINERVTESLRRYLEARARLTSVGVLPPLDMEDDSRAIRDALRTLADDSSAEARDTVALLRALVELGDDRALGVDGPAWYRGSVYCIPLLERPLLDDALRRIAARRVVVGHTPTGDRRARALHDGRLIMLDTGMLTEYYAGRPAALLIEGERIAVQYLNPVERLGVEHGSIEAYALTEAEIVDALSRGEIRAMPGERPLRASGAEPRGAIGQASRPVQVGHDGNTFPAIFYRNDRTRAGAHELAAYTLDRMLGLELVPPTAAREFAGVRGAVQLQYADAITETARVESNAAVADWCPLEPQAELLNLFDLLIFNKGRSGNNILYRAERSVMKLTEHAEAFGTERRLRLDGLEIEVPPPLRDALESLDAERLEEALGTLLDSRQRRALLARRDQILEHLGGEE